MAKDHRSHTTAAVAFDPGRPWISSALFPIFHSRRNRLTVLGFTISPKEARHSVGTKEAARTTSDVGPSPTKPIDGPGWASYKSPGLYHAKEADFLNLLFVFEHVRLCDRRSSSCSPALGGGYHDMGPSQDRWWWRIC